MRGGGLKIEIGMDERRINLSTLECVEDFWSMAKRGRGKGEGWFLSLGFEEREDLD